MNSAATELPYASESTADNSHQWWWSWGKLWTVCATLLLAWLLIFCWNCVQQALWILSEMLVFWKVAFGTTRSMKKNLRVHVYLCETQYLDEVSVNELYNFLLGMLSSESVTVQDLHKVLLSYSHIMICREKMDGSLRGITLLGLDRKEKYTLLKFGLVVFKNFYQGGPFLYLIPAYMAIRELIFHPFTPLYVVGKAFTYKSYMMIIKFREFYPRYDRGTPEFFKNIIHDYAQSVKRPNETYDPETFILERELSQARRFLAPISEKDLLNPNIKFFNERNPGWRKPAARGLTCSALPCWCLRGQNQPRQSHYAVDAYEMDVYGDMAEVSDEH